MSTTYGGNPANVVGAAALNILASTNTSPIQITTTAAHGLLTNDVVDVVQHATNTNANGVWPINVLSTTSFSLIGSTGNGVGGATGNVQLVSRGAAGSQWSDGDTFNAANLNLVQTPPMDRSSFLLKNTSFVKLVGRVVIGFSSPGEAAFVTGPAGALTAGTWYPFLTSPSALSVQTMLQGAYGPLTNVPPYGFFGVANLDIVRVTLQCGLRSNPAQTATRVGLFYAMVAPGASVPTFTSFIQVPNTSQSADLATASAEQPINLSGWVVAPASGNIYIYPAYYTINNITAPTTTLEGDAVLSIEGYRGTGWPQ